VYVYFGRRTDLQWLEVVQIVLWDGPGNLREILLGCNRRYLEYLSSLDDFSAGIRALDRLTQPRPVNGRIPASPG
jgi:hypothetical protein